MTGELNKGFVPKVFNYDVLVHLLQFLDFEDLMIMKQVSQEFCLAADYHLMRIRHLVVGKSFQEYSNWCRQSEKRSQRTRDFFRTITFKRLEFGTDCIERIRCVGNNCKDIESVTLFDCDLCLFFIQVFVDNFQRLRNWTFVDISEETFERNKSQDFKSMGRALIGKVDFLYLSLDKQYTASESVNISLIFENLVVCWRDCQWI